MKISVTADVVVKNITTNYTRGEIEAQGSIIACGRGDSPIDVMMNVPMDKDAFRTAVSKMKANELDVPSVETAVAMVQAAIAKKFAMTVEEENGTQ